MQYLQKKSLGIDELPIGTVFKDNLDIFGMTVVDIVNKNLAQGIFSLELEIAKIVPIYIYLEKETKLRIIDPFCCSF